MKVRTACSVPSIFIFCLVLAAAPLACAQSNPIPFINNPLVPVSAAAGGPGLTLTINGGGFASGAVANWTVGRITTPLATTVVSGTQLTATVPASLLAAPATATVTAANAGGLPSAGSFFQVGHPTAGVVFPQPTATIAVGTNPGQVITADLNGDGKLDIATVNETDGTISVILGNGDGTFQGRKDYPGGPATSLVAGDFNGDGKTDLALTNESSSGAVSILLGNGDGSFQLPVTYPVGAFPGAIVVGDFNQDGKLDLAVLNICGSDPTCGSLGSVSILLGNGDGSLQPQPPLTTIQFPLSLAVGDVNRDGKLDLLVSTSTYSEVSVLLGNGDGTFQALPSYSVPGAFFMTLADFNGDGIPDLVIGDSTGIELMLGNGDGSFQSPRIITLPFGADALAVGDFNGDGKLDLAASTTSNSGGLISLVLGNGDGTFQTAVSYPSGVAANAIAIGDFNGDGLLDTVTTAFNASTITVLLQSPLTVSPTSLAFGATGIGTPAPAQNVSLTNTGLTSVPIGSISFTGRTPKAFTQTNNCGSSLAAGATCTFSVTFTPGAKGQLADTMTVSTGIGATQQFQVSLTGTGGLSTFSLTPPRAVNFGNQTVGTTSSPQTITLKNTGALSLGITKIVKGGRNAADFILVMNNCPAVLTAGASCTVTVSFAPTQLGTRKGLIRFFFAGNKGVDFLTLEGVGD